MSDQKNKVSYINEELHSRIKALAAKKKMPMKELIEKVLDAYEQGRIFNG